MKNSFGIIYFVHDDPRNNLASQLMPAFLNTQISSSITVLIIRNVRLPHPSTIEDGPFEYVTSVYEIKHDSTPSEFKRLTSGVQWPEAFQFAFNYLLKTIEVERIGLMTLSHSNGLVINRNSQVPGATPSISSVLGDANTDADRKKNKNLRYIEGRAIIHDQVYITTETVVSRYSIVPNTGNKLFESSYTRKENESCKTYEGLFVYEFCDFLQNELVKYPNQDGSAPKLAFFISGNCNFQLYDNISLLVPITDFVFGAQSRCWSHFWDFQCVITAIDKNLSKSNEDMCKDIFMACKQRLLVRNADSDLHKFYFLSNTRIFSESRELFEQMLGIIMKNITNTTGYKQKFIATMNRLVSTAQQDNLAYYDVVDFFTTAMSVPGIKFEMELSEFKAFLVNALVVPPFGRLTPTPSGFSLYYPKSKQEFDKLGAARCNYFNRDRGDVSTFALNSCFDEFLLRLFA